jgi:hypothetical protein
VLLSSGSQAPTRGPLESRAIAGSRRATRPVRALSSRAPRDRGRASERRSGRSGEAVYVQRAPSTRAPRRSSPGRSLARLPRRARGCRVPTPAGRSFEGGPARSTLLLSGAERRSESRARNLRQRADLVQALFPSSYGQGPSVSPCARWAGTACWSTMIVTDGFVADSVRWQITTLCPY